MVLAAALSLTPVVALAQPVQPEPRPTDVALPRSPFVDIRLSPDLGDAGLRVRAALARLPVRIAEPADYELTTKRNFPQTLIAIDVRQLPQDWGTDFSAATDEPGQVPRTFELGNFVLGDYRGGLRNLVARAARAKALLALESPGGAVGIDTCVAWSEQRDGNLVGPPCHVPPGDRTVWGNDSNHRDLFSVEVRNSTAAPRYVAVLTVEPWLGVQRLVLGGTSPETPLAPGEIAKSGIIELLHYWSERFFLVTLASDRPIDPSAFLQPTLDMDSQLGCGDETSSCPPSIAIAADTQGWSVSVAEYVVDRERLAAIGGGASVLDGMALWMAAIYSTVPYTRSEIAADALRPVNEREHLAERNPRELAHRCGASLIAPNLVLTAAHCVAKGRYAGEGMARVMSERRVRIGTPYLGRGGTTYAIAGVAVPAAYLPGNQNHDIALLLIKPDRDTHLRERPTIPLGSRSLNAGTRLTAFGWGYTGSVAPGADPMFNLAEELQRNPDRLQFGEMAVLDWGKCRRRLAARLARGMVCMVAPGADVGPTPERNVFTCRGDSGGPLVRKVGETEELVGVTSWSMGCGYRDYPSVYTDVTKYGRWIAAARQQLVPGAAIRVDERAAPSREEGRPQSR